MHSRLLSVDNIDKRRLQAGAADKEAIDIGLLSQLAAVLLRDAAAVQDPGLLSCLRGDLLLEPLTDSSMDFLCLLRGSDLAGADSPIITSDSLKPTL
jgi:hypothetical protein